MRPSTAFLVLLVVVGAESASADTVEVAPGERVTRRTYDVEINEAPFFNFAAKSAAQKEADRRYIKNALKVVGGNSTEAARRAAGIGFRYLQQSDFSSAAKRFNQSYLLDNRHSGPYHGFAIIVFTRFRDADFSDELFRVAARMSDPEAALPADHGQMLMLAGRFEEAVPVLQHALQSNELDTGARANLAIVLFETGKSDEACKLIAKGPADGWGGSASDVALLRKRAGCV